MKILQGQYYPQLTDKETEVSIPLPWAVPLVCRRARVPARRLTPKPRLAAELFAASPAWPEKAGCLSAPEFTSVQKMPPSLLREGGLSSPGALTAGAADLSLAQADTGPSQQTPAVLVM